ncbi:MAG: ATP-binding protein [Nitrospinota bacterium]
MGEKELKSENMLVKLENLNQLLSLAGEVIIASSNLEIAFRSLQSLYDKRQPVTKEALESVNDLTGSTSDISTSLHRLVQTIRTVDLKDLSFRARRLVRDVARRTGKRIEFEFVGEETNIDKTIVEKLYDPISHQIRNAIDHGIEDSLTRERNGKPSEGKITLSVYNTENETFIEIEDDGRGVDIESLRKKGIEKSLVDHDAPFTEEDALNVMFAAGVSTAETVSQVSGRGVGMDVVRDRIFEMGGTVSFSSKPGEGTLFTFRVPLISAVNIVDALVVRSGRHMFAFPVSSVVTTMSVPPGDIHSAVDKGAMVMHLGNLLPLHDLNYVLDGNKVEYEGENASVLVIEHKGETVAFRISEFFSPQKLVIIPFNGAFNLEGLSGTTILGGRRLGLIVDVPALISRATGRLHGMGRAKTGTNGGAGKIAEKRGGKEEKPETVETAKPQPEKEGEGTVEDDTEAVREFIMEVEKLLPSLNESLFALESDFGNSDEMNKAFRLLHTIKGNFIMMGLPKAGETVHSVESVLDRARSRKMDLVPEIMDVLMDSASFVEEVVRQCLSGEWKDSASSEIMEASARLLPEQRTEQRIAADIASEEVKVSHESLYRMNLYRKSKTPFYRCYIEFESGNQPPFLVACLMYKRFYDVGDVLGSVPPLVDIENGNIENKFKVLFATTADPDKLEKSIVSMLTNYYGANMVKLNRFE